MAKNIKSLSMLRNTTAFESKADALSGLTAVGTDDGVIKLARYTDGDKTKTLFGIYNTINSSYTVYDFDTDAETSLVNLVNTINGVDTVEGSFRKAIKDTKEALDYTGNTEAGKFVTNVTETDGIIAVTIDTVSASVVAQSSEKAAISGAATVQAALNALADKAAAITIVNQDGSIVVTPDNGGNGTDVKVHVKTGEKVIKLDANGGGLYTNLNLVKITTGLSAEIKESYELHDSDGNKIGDSIDVPKDSHIVSITYITDSGDEHYQNLKYEYIDNSGNTKVEYVDMAALVLEVEVENGIQSIDHKLSIKLDTTGDDTGDGKFLTVGANGLKLDGVSDAIAAAVDALDVTGDTAVDGQYVAAIQEADGIVSVKARANVSEAVLNNYAKGSDATAVAATDTVNQAVSKLENQIDKAKAAATTKVVEGTDAGNNMEIVPTTSITDSSVTYTINLTDVASDSALTAEIDARMAVDGQTGQTYVPNTGVNYIGTATSLNDADVKLDAALKAEEAARIAGDSALTDVINALDANSVSGESKVVIDVTQEDGQITATAANLTGVKLDGLTTGTDAKIAATDTLGEALANIQGQIDAMDKDASAVDGQVVTTVAEADGKVTETKANVKDLQLGGYSKDTAATGDIASTDTINAALSKLENKAAAITIGNDDGSINVTTAATGTDINVNIKSGEHVLAKTGDAGLYTDIKLSGVTPIETNVREQYALFGTDGTKLGADIKIYKDSSLTNIYIGHVDDVLTNADASGESEDTAVTNGTGDTALVYIMHLENDKYKLAAVNVQAFLEETEFASGVVATNHIVHGVVDSTSENFLTVGADGFKLAGVQDAINTAKAAAKTEVALKDGESVLVLSADTTAADGHVKYILNTQDVASAALLNTTIAGAGLKADGTYSANTADKYISSATSLADADDKLDAALFSLSGKVGNVSVVGEKAINVAEQTQGDKNYKVTLVLNKPADVTENFLSQDANGLTYSSILDCGTY